MTDVDTSSYLKPQPQQNPFDTITKYGQAADALGNVEAGKAVQGAIGPDGEIDRNALAQSLKGTVAGSMKAIPTLNAYETLRQAGHVADEAGLDNFQKRMGLINHLFGGLASKDNPTIQDVNSVAARVLDPAVNGPKYGVTFPVVMNALKSFRGPDGRPLSSADIKKKALEIQTMTASSAEQLAAHSPKYAVTDDGTKIDFTPVGTETNPKYPTVVKRIPTGTPQIDSDPSSPTYRQPVLTPPQPPAPTLYKGSAGQGNLVTAAVTPSRASMGQTEPTPENQLPATFQERYGSSLRGAPAAALRPGSAEALQATAINSAKMGNDLNTAANEAPATRGILDNLERELKNFTPGPGADYRRLGKALANTVIPDSLKEKIGFDPKSIADQEGFNKLAYNLAQNQFQALGGTGTDAKLNSTMATSPSELLSKEGNAGIIRLLKGNTDALIAKNKAWNAYKKANGPDSYSDFADEFNENFNPRVFQYKYVPKAERQGWINGMSADEKAAFLKSAEYARDKKWLKKEDLQ